MMGNQFEAKTNICNKEKTNIVRRQIFSMLPVRNICQKKRTQSSAKPRMTRQDIGRWKAASKIRKTEFKTWNVVFVKFDNTLNKANLY